MTHQGISSGGVFGNAPNITVGIIGYGRLGSALANAFFKQGNLLWICTRSQQSMQRAMQQFDNQIMIITDPALMPDIPTIIILAVPDNELSALEEYLAGLLVGMNTVIMHCSGALGLRHLDKCSNAGLITIAAHPFQTFIAASDTAFRGIAWGVECNPDDFILAETLINSLNGMAIPLSEHTIHLKALYHATAVMASNFITALIATAHNAAQCAGIEAELFLPPILFTAAENAINSLGQKEMPLTGPIVRGDDSTIRNHKAQLAAFPELDQAYTALSRITLGLAVQQGLIPKDKAESIALVLE
jgi:predicted short-subunit dehydrogenase-like oxidoreductase (DUF2520 family)